MSFLPAYSHYVFDLDGTLVDSICGIDTAARYALAEISTTVDFPSMRSFIGPPIRVMLERALGWTDSTKLDTLEQAFRFHYDGGTWRESPPYENVDATLRKLHAHGARLYILTNKPPVPTMRIIEHLGWIPLFDAIVSPQSCVPPAANKPCAAIYLRDHFGLKTTETLLVGDSSDDLAAARYTGFAFAAARWGYGHAAVEAPISAIATFSDILDVKNPSRQLYERPLES
jgi:phosphoglycolate phosphatase